MNRRGEAPASAYGEAHPRPADTRRPVVLVVLDGLGDRPLPELGGRTPAEAADTPVLDALAARGASGLHLPFGWGRAASSERAHWALFGYGRLDFPGRAVLEALGAGREAPYGVPLLHAALRCAEVRDGRVWVTGRAARDDAADADALVERLRAALAPGAELVRLRAGEALLALPGETSADVADSDPFFEDRHPWLAPVPLADADDPPAAAATSRRLVAVLRSARAALVDAPENARRRERGRPALDLLTTKWAGLRRPLPPFAAYVGLPGAAVTSSALYRGFARLLGWQEAQVDALGDPAADMAARLAAARRLLARGAGFVHVHTKATDEAGHSRDPHAKRDLLGALDAGLAALHDLADEAVVAVTGDHATPSAGGLLHSGDPTPLVVAGPTVRADRVRDFGEGPAADGAFGVLRAEEVLALLLGYADRPRFLGHRAGPYDTLALPDDPPPMPIG